ncbi:uncharacterized protein PFL1_04433 [Pseudozyma flocculosa PF-1]|uniref:Related to conserved mitochondrial protein n=2 Tax=Pseudozyma flocculosa TaxID=84751 RepID=A0A5C3FBT3_9BASI|nr:uncharacterized protein PFL1_04433 [Pseudozyma flocculosa PF-1]EPQ28106.1 hypothetical protein PFL1_04433 [Pseudozyma flocculosa PF-1]SPO41904.1 related to conserved mitochondrial protein [Pseudozyma flocculosa]
MSKGRSLPEALKSLLKQPTFPSRVSALSATRHLPAGRSADPSPTPRLDTLKKHFVSLEADAIRRGLGWGEWLSVATATILTLNNPGSLQSLHRVAMRDLANDLEARKSRALLMREIGLKCIGFIGIPKVINNLAALRKAVDQDPELAQALPTETRRHITPDRLPAVHKAAYGLWDDIYTPHSEKLLKILGTSHPDLPVFIVESEYGPLFAPPATYSLPSDPAHLKQEPEWEVNRLRTSLVAISALRAQGGVGPQVTSHVWGLMKAAESISPADANKRGLEWLATEEGALWVVKTVDSLCQAIEGAEELEQHKSKL